MPKVLRALRGNYPHLRKYVVVRGESQNISDIERESDDEIVLIYNPEDYKLKDLMLEADVAISAGGQTLHELARIGVPTIAITVAENQLRNSKSWEKAGFVEYAGCWRDSDIISNIHRCLKHLEDKSVRFEKYRIAKNLVGGDGARNVIRFATNQSD
jgi:UDP-2,4-diacetamido-2,4,6-trideoxy-beta-L-altropyranose hydrolase